MENTAPHTFLAKKKKQPSNRPFIDLIFSVTNYVGIIQNVRVIPIFVNSPFPMHVFSEYVSKLCHADT